jgi:hypothetical protein
LGDVKSPTEKRPPLSKWWAVSLALVVLGTLGIIFVPHGPEVGPSVTAPIGQVTLPPSGILPTTTARTTTVPATSTPTTSGGGPTTPSSTPPPTSPTTPPTTAPRTPTTVPRVATPINRSRPVHLSIPQIGLSVALSTLGLNPDGTVSVPSDYATPGWFKDGPTPGQKGSAVILGHVDNQNGPAVFYHLDRLGVGSRVFVTLYNGRRLEFAVIGVRMFSKTNFPNKLVYGYRPYPALQLVTCGGVFDANTGHYLSNIVVFTALVKS